MKWGVGVTILTLGLAVDLNSGADESMASYYQYIPAELHFVNSWRKSFPLFMPEPPPEGDESAYQAFCDRLRFSRGVASVRNREWGSMDETMRGLYVAVG